jgi:hypothetical protein
MIRNEEVGDLDMQTHFPGDFYGALHVFQFTLTDFPVKFRPHRLKIEIGGVYILENFAGRFLVYVAVGDDDGNETGVFEQSGGIVDIFIPYQRFGISVRNAYRTARAGKFNQIFGRNIPGGGFLLGDGPVLAKFAGQIAAIGADGDDIGAGLEMIQRFLFDGIDAQSDCLSVSGGIKNAVPIDPDGTDAALGWTDYTFERTQQAFYREIVSFLVKPGFDVNHNMKNIRGSYKRQIINYSWM